MRNRFLQSIFFLGGLLAFVLSPCLGSNTAASLQSQTIKYDYTTSVGSPKSDTICGLYLVTEEVPGTITTQLKMYTYSDQEIVNGVEDVSLDGVSMEVTYFANLHQLNVKCATE